MQKPDPLIRTKLRKPFIRPNLVPMPRLRSRVTAGLQGPLTLVIAPAGFGKTTLVAASLADCHTRAAWLSLDKDDNQVSRFLAYLVAALQGVDPQVGREAVQLMAGMQPAPSEAVLTSLINDLDAAGEDTVLVLDDYQFISSQVVHEALAFFLEHCPSSLHLCIATRSDPALPLARLRARSQMVELRTDDLRFTNFEAAQFLNEIMGLHLDSGSVAVLEERTEGWVAGLQMAALSMQGREDVHGFVENFSGTHRHILDYLLEEVLASQPPEIQRFLLYTSILERLTAPLCDAVMADGAGAMIEGEGSSDRSTSAQFQQSTAILEYLDHANLFLIPLDDERVWYRYHHLFADLLASQLLHAHPHIVPGLHYQASSWYEQNGWFEQAVVHAFSAGDLDRAGRLIESGAQRVVGQVPFAIMQGWINRLPEEMVLKKSWISITQAWLWVATMQTDGLDNWMDKIEMHFSAGGKDCYSESEQQDILANIASLRAYDALFKGDLQRCADLSNQALKLLSPANIDLRARILVQLGETYLALYDMEQASNYLPKGIDAGIAVEDFQSVTTASMRLYQALKILGRLNEAEEMILGLFQVLARVGRANSPVATKLEQCWGDLLRERGQMTEADVQLTQALEHARLYNSPLDIVTSLINRSRWLLNRADPEAAQKVLEEAGSVIGSYTIPPVVIDGWSLQLAQVYLEKGEFDRAEQSIHNPLREESRIFQSRLLLKKGEFEKAKILLSQLEQDAASGQRNGSLIQIYLETALVFQVLGEPSRALETLVKCLTLAEPQAYLMTFLAEGEAVHHLLESVQKNPLPKLLEKYVFRLLQAFEQRKSPTPLQADRAPQTLPIVQGQPVPASPLVEPLSPREEEVLQLLAEGKTNPAIAAQLVVSPGTVKAHTASIYRKLDVANRTEAVVRARQLGILP